MVAIVGGMRSGLDLGSLEVLGLRENVGGALQGRNGQGVYVNVAQGQVVVQDQDDLLVARGQDAALVRTYNSNGAWNDDNGDGWTSGVSLLRLTGTPGAIGSTIQRVGADGAAATYDYDPVLGLYVSTEGSGAYDTIASIAADAQYEWRDGSTGATQRYEGGGALRLLASRDASGNAVTYAYGANGFLASVTTANGDTVWYDYAGNNLSQVRTTAAGVTTTRVRYGYDASNRLTSVTMDLTPADNSIADGKVYQTTYAYDGTSKRIASITQSDGTSVAFTYVDTGGGVYKVASVRDGLGQATTFTYGLRFTTVTDPLGFVTRYDYDAASQLTAITGPAVGGTSAMRQFAYDSRGNVSSVTDGEGRTTTYQYDDRGNQVLQRDAAGNTVARTFDARNQLLSETRYTEPDPDGAGSAAPSGALVSRQVYDDAGRNLLRFAVSAEGRVVEYRYNGFGQRVAAITYAAAAYPFTGPAVDGSFTESALVGWVAAQDLRASQRVDFTYDARGELETRTTYANVASSGAGVLDGAQAVERFVYDASGRLLQAVSPRSGTTTYTYDGLGRTLTATDALGRVTVTQYDDAGRKTLVTLASGLVTTTTMDAAGRVLATAQSGTAGAALGETRYFYDADNRLRMTQDPTGVRSWVLYDEAGRKTAEIDGNGSMKEYVYDRRNLVTGTTTWGTAVNTAALVDAAGLPVLSVMAASLRPPESANDAGVWRQYDSAGRLVREAASTGTGAVAAVTEMRYDGASRLVQTVRYANTIATTAGSGNVGNGVVALPLASAQDRVTRQFYDGDGRLAATLDAEGYLATFRYTAAGQLSETLAYATATPASLRAAGTLAQLLPAASAADLREQTFYNARGQVTSRVDGEGYVTETVYDTEGNAAQTIRYATPLPAGTNPLPGAPVRPAPSPSDRSTLRAFDALNRLVQETSPEGVVTQYAYDTVGNLVSTVRAAGTGEVRTLLARYDVQGRLTGELSAEGAALLTGGQTQAQVDAIWAQYGTSHAYDAASRRISSTDALGNRTLYFYDADGALTHTVNALGEVRESRYDARGRVVENVAYAGRIATAGLTGGLVPLALTNAVAAIANAAVDGRVTLTYTHDSQIASTAEADGAVATSTYNAFGEETSRQLTGGATNLLETYALDRRGLRTGTVQDAAGANAVTSTVYDAFGRAVRTVDANGNVREQVYDRSGRVLTWKDPTNAVRSASYDAFDRVLTQTDALGNVTRYAYDAAARSLQVTTAEGIVTTTFYTRHGQVERVVDGNSQQTSYVYDRNGNLLRTVLPVGTTSGTYDAVGRVTETVDANGNRVAFTYDAAHRMLTRRVDPAGLNLTTTYQYDGKGQRVSVTDPMGVVTTVEYDRKGRVLKQTLDPTGLNLQTVSSYDARGNVLTVRSPGGSMTQYVYDALGRRTQERVDPAGLNLQRSWSYDRNGNVVGATDARGNLTRQAYDGNDRLVFTVDPVGNVRELAYDAAGRVSKTVAYAAPVAIAGLATAPTVGQVRALVTPQPALDVVEHRVYDKDGRLAATVDGTGAVVRYTYDADGNVTARTAFATRIALAGWTPGTLPAPVADPEHDTTVRTVYDGLNRAIYSIDGVGAVVARSYDNNGNLLQRTAYATPVAVTTAATASVLAAAVALVANVGRDATVRNTYDAAGRLTWTVDGTGAVSQRVYDKNGNVVRRVEYATALAQGAVASTVAARAGDRTATLAYDPADRLVFEIDTLRGVTEQAYDADGHVIRRTAYATPIASVPAAGLPGTVAAVRSALVVNAAADRSTRWGWDAAGRRAMEVDAAGAVTETQYDGVGNVIATTAYADVVDPAALGANPTLAAIRALVHPNTGADRITRTAYDAAGQALYNVDAVGAVRANQYDGAGRLTRTTRYANAIDLAIPNTAGAIAAALTSDPAKDQVDAFAYNAAGQRVSSTDALGGTESFTYDALGHKLSFVNKKGAAWAYTYDAAGRMLMETSPEVSATTVAANDQGPLVAGAPAAVRIVTRLAYDALGQLTQRTEAAGRPEERSTRYEYDAAGRQVRVIHPPVRTYDGAADAVTTNGAAGLAVRVEAPLKSLDTQTFYDTLGNAVANRDIGGALSQKAYDVMGRVAYEVDALGYVTGYSRNAFGDATGLVRYGAATTLANVTVTQASQAMSKAQVESALSAAGVDHSRDRSLVSVHDRAGRVVEKIEPTAYVYDSSAAANPTDNAGRRTQYTYDAFGQVAKEKVLRNQRADTWATTTHYFDRTGHEIGTVDAMGYVTERKFDVLGNLWWSLEYANAAPGWSPGSAAPAASQDNRKTIYIYDRLNRKTSETREQVEYSANPDGTSIRGNLVTSFGYDAVGNQTWVTDAGGRTTYTSYDALGRVRAIAAPARSSTASGAIIVPVTSFQRDAYGNAVLVVEHAQGAARATATDIQLPAADGADRRTLSAFDSFGRAAQVMDAEGWSTYFSYDAYGHAAKKWQAVTGNDGATRTSFEVSVYDKLGRIIETRTPTSTSVDNGSGVSVVSQAQAGLVVAATGYNAFGEVTRKGTQGGGQEYFDYDNAGRLWRTNSGDGVDRIQLYDLQGNVTAEIRSAGTGRDNVDIKAFANAEAAAVNPSTRRVDLQVDLLGRVTSRAEAVRQESQGGVVVQHQFTSVTVQANTGVYYPTRTNRVTLTWNSLAALGSGDVRVTLEYRTPVVTNWDPMLEQWIPQGGTMRSYTSGVLVGDAWASGNTLVWDVDATADLEVASVTRVLVLKKDWNGHWQTVMDQPPGHGANSLFVQAPPDPDATTQLYLRAAGSAGDAGWWAAGLVNFVGGSRFDASGLAPGNYEYRVVTTEARTLASRVTATGVVGVSLPALNSIPGLQYGLGGVGRGVMTWASPEASYTQAFRYRPNGSTGAWSTLAVVPPVQTAYPPPPANTSSVDTSGLAPGTYQFELLWTPNGQNAPSSHATGTFTIVPPVPAQWVPPRNLPPINGVAMGTGVYGGVLNGYTDSFQPIYWGGTACYAITWPAVNANVAQYRVPGGAWMNLTLDNNGQFLNEGATPAGTQKALLYGIPPGTYEVRITAGSPPSMQATANLTVYSQPAGYWTTVYVTTRVATPLYDEYGNFTGEYTYTDKTEEKQQWVQPATPAPTITITTPPYVPGYWTQPVPAQYSVSVTTPAGSSAISTTQGSGIGQGVWTNGDSRWLRPVVKQKVDRWGNVVEISDPRLASWITTYRYNADNQLVQQVLPDAGKGTATTSISYDALGRQVAVRDANGHVNGQVFDAGGNLVEERHADTGVVRYRYNAFGDKVISVDAMGHAVGYTYDKLSRLVRIDKGEAGVWRPDETTATLVQWRMLSDSWSYDQLGRKLSQTNAAGEVVQYTYDLPGNVIATRQIGGAMVRAVYDAQGRKTAETDANGSTLRWTYDYFGRLTGHMDLQGYQFSYTYDNARQLTSQTSTRGVSISYSYDAAGQLTTIRDWATDKTTTYVYDLSGRKLRERVVQAGITYQDNNLAYDARGNLRDVTDGRAHITMEYDQVGNRTRVATFVDYQGEWGEVGTSSDRYFQYDAMNRQTKVDAVDAAGNIGQQGHSITYDKNGNRTSDTYWGNKVVVNGGDPVIAGYDENGTAIYVATPRTYTEATGNSTEEYRYDSLNRLESVIKDQTQIDIRRYDAADRVVQSGPAGTLDLRYAEIINRGLTPEQMNGKETRINYYDGNGRLVHQTVRKSDNTLKMDISWNSAEASTGWGQTWYADGYDAAGNVLGYTVRNHEAGYMNEYRTTSFKRFDSYQAEVTTGQSTKLLPGSTTQQYDVNGFLVGIVDSKQAGNNRTFVNDASGKALYVNQAGRIQRQLVVNGEVLGLYGAGVDPDTPATGYDNVPKFANVVDFDFGYARISNSYPAPSPGAYTVRTGDTLQTIAQGAYGDSSLWFRIAEANGLASSNDLRVGQTLNIPNRVSTINNNATTFKPYDPSRIEGDKTPSLAMPKPKKSSWLKQLLVAVIAVVVAYFTGQWYLANFGTGACTVSAAGVASTWTTSSLVAAGAAGGAAGSIASQAVGVAIGEQESFDWKAVGLSAISGGISTGLGGFDGAGGVTTGPLAQPVIRAAVTNALTQGIGVVTGLQDRFDWRGVAASTVGAVVGQEVGGRIGGSFAGRLVTALAAGAAAAAARGGRVELQQVAVDAFGNALGQSIAENANGIERTAPQTEDVLGDFIMKNYSRAHADAGPAPALVDGRTFSEDAGLRRGAMDPYGLRTEAGMAPQVSGPGTLDLAQAHDQWAVTGRKPTYDFGDPFQVEGDGPLAQNLVRVVRGGGVHPATVNGISVNSRVEALLNAAAEGDVTGMGNLYRDYKLLSALMNEGMQDDTLKDLKKQLQHRLGVMRNVPSEEALGARSWIGADGVVRYDKADLIDRYADALRKVGLARQGAIELNYTNFEIRTIGNAKLTPAQYLAEVEARYQRAFARGVELGEQGYARGELRYPADMPKQLQVGLFADDFGKRVLLTYNTVLAVPEGPGQILSLNRWAYDPQGTAQFVRHDVLIDFGPNGRYWIDGKTSLMEGQNSTKQFETFYRYTNAAGGKVATPQGLFNVLPSGKIRR